MEIEKFCPYYFEHYFGDNGYDIVKPYNVVNNNSDTVFITAGIQPILNDVIEGNIISDKNMFIGQPVIRTQFIDSLSEGYSLAFVNGTSVAFDNSYDNYTKMILDWLELFYDLGLKKENFTFSEKDYERNWGNLIVKGYKKFLYYNGLELGDATFFYDIDAIDRDININTFSDIGFGLERVKWCVNPDNGYYDINDSSEDIDPQVKAFLSVIALLVVNGVKPTNKNSGYRLRLFCKKMISLIGVNDLDKDIDKYLDECINYWMEWQNRQDISISNCREILSKELVRCGNRYIIDKLLEEGYINIKGININVDREEFVRRLSNSSVDKKILRKVINGYE